MDIKYFVSSQSAKEPSNNIGRAECIKAGAVEDIGSRSYDSESPINEKKGLREMDRQLLPMLALLYLMSFLGRGNIGNAKIEGLAVDLKLSGQQYNWCCKIPHISYLFFRPCY